MLPAPPTIEENGDLEPSWIVILFYFILDRVSYIQFDLNSYDYGLELLRFLPPAIHTHTGISGMHHRAWVGLQASTASLSHIIML